VNTAAFARVARAESLPARLDLIQLDVCWRSDPDAIRVRDELDQRIYRELMAGASVTVRRLVLYDIPSDEREHRPRNAIHMDWVDGLVRDLYHLDMPGLGADAHYQIKQVILDRAGRPDHLPPDGVSTESGDGWASQFEQLWRHPRSIQNNLVPAGLISGPEADRDPGRDLWR
jgi:hypothetical protein